jgi:GNAT superfamily N-acetyltransferase
LPNFTLHIHEGHPDNALQNVVFVLYEAIFHVMPPPKVAQRLETAEDLLIQVASAPDGQAAGYKVAYRQSPEVLYSWIGGVLPQYRGQGLAARMMEQQHHWAKERGYARVQTKTMNRWRDMLILNLRHGFEIKETYPGEDGQLRIVLEKNLA